MRALIYAAIAVAVLAFAFSLDATVATHLRDSGFAAWLKHSWLATVLKFPGEFWCTAIVAVAVFVIAFRQRSTVVTAPSGDVASTSAPTNILDYATPVDRTLWKIRWRESILILLAALASGVNGLVKWIAGRKRPFTDLARRDEIAPFLFHPFINGFDGLVHAKNLCFPSGHGTLAFATAGMLAQLFPRRWLVFYFIASLTAAERVLENAHYLSDSVAAAILGILCAKVIYAMGRRWLLKTPPPSTS
jgi:membrane-associated phospholipid phosphatase